MSSTETTVVSGFAPVPQSAAKTRVVTAAIDLFAEHGVSGTSLQMIADAIGVTKAAVYHQFKTKEEIVVASVEAELVRLEDALAAAEADDDHARAQEILLTRVIDLAVERRRLVGTLLNDPVIARLLEEREPFQEFMRRLFRILVGGDTSAESRVRAAMIGAAIGGAVTSRVVADLDPATLHSQLLRLTKRFLDLPT